MPIIMENQSTKADISFIAGLLDIEFKDDPSFTRGELVVLDLPQRSISIIFSDALHHVGHLPTSLGRTDILAMTHARLHGHGAGGREIQLNAPIKIIR